MCLIFSKKGEDYKDTFKQTQTAQRGEARLRLYQSQKEAKTLRIQLFPLIRALGVIVDILLRINSIWKTALALMKLG